MNAQNGEKQERFEASLSLLPRMTEIHVPANPFDFLHP